jgi:hypothetical protein
MGGCKMKKCQPQLRSQHIGSNKYLYKNNKPKLAKKPINKFTSYESLLNEFFDQNPTPTDVELSNACLYFAKQCGLKLSPKVRDIVKATGGLYVD